jgi:PhnB protein
MSTTLIQPYLFFAGRGDEAIEFYRTALGAEVEMCMHYKDNPEPQNQMPLPPGWENKIMHASLRIGGTHVFLSDGCGPTPAGAQTFQGFSLSLNAPNEAEAKRIFEALSAGGEVRLPISKTFFSPCFGMLADRFGVGWMVIVHP